MGVLATFVLPTLAAVPDSIEAMAIEQEDSIVLKVTAYKIETQLTFLMQGLTIRIEQPDTLALVFPSAKMVKHKVKRHPNEVKAVLASQRKLHGTGHDSIHQVVRPDVQPLVVALNDTTATAKYKGSTIETRSFHIDVDRERAIMTFDAKIPRDYLNIANGTIVFTILSIPPNGDLQEFDGKRLSGDKAPTPNGLGEGIKKGDDTSRTIYKSFKINF